MGLRDTRKTTLCCSYQRGRHVVGDRGMGFLPEPVWVVWLSPGWL